MANGKPATQENAPSLELVLARHREVDTSRFTAELEQLSSDAQALIIQDASGEARAADLGKRIKAIAEQAEDERTRIVGPFNDVVKFINARFKVVSELSDRTIKHLKDGIGKYRAVQAERQRAEDERLQKEAAKRQAAENKKAEKKGVEPKFIPPPPPPMEAPKTVVGQSGTSTVKKVWDFKVENPSLVPDDYWTLDEKKIRAAVKSIGVRTIPGVRIFQRDDVAFGG